MLKFTAGLVATFYETIKLDSYKFKKHVIASEAKQSFD